MSTATTPFPARINAAAQVGASVSAATLVAERLGLTGIYTGVCEGFKTQHEKEYLVEFSHLASLRARRDEMLRQPGQHDPAELRTLVQHLGAFEAYMRTLTEVKWAAPAPNIVTTPGANAILDSGLAGSAYTAACYMGLIGAAGYTGAPVAGDTMAAHGTWTEAGGVNAPTYTGPRKTVAWSAASAKSKSPSSAPVFAMTGPGTVKGVFLVFGAGAVSTLDSTAGVLYSAGLFTGGDQVVAATNTLTVTYSATA